MQSIIEDGELTYDELYQLAEWLNSYREACVHWPGSLLVEPLQRTWADGKVAQSHYGRCEGMRMEEEMTPARVEEAGFVKVQSGSQSLTQADRGVHKGLAYFAIRPSEAVPENKAL